MARGSFKPSVKHDLHDNKHRGISLGATGSSFLVNKKLIADKDTCINRENPLRNVGKRYRLVVGYDHKGTFDKAIPAGNTHGYWTLANNNGFGDIDGATAADGGGFGITSSYLARTLLQFDLNEAGLTKGDSVVSCYLDLEIANSNTVSVDTGITLDFHRFHAGHSVNVGDIDDMPTVTSDGFTGVGDKHNWDDSATWYEWKYSGLHEAYLSTTGDSNKESFTGPGTGPYGTIDHNMTIYGLGTTYDGGTYNPGFSSSGSIEYNDFYPSTVYAWDFQGLGSTGANGPYAPGAIGSCTGSDDLVLTATRWADFSDGASASNTWQFGGFCNTYATLPHLYLKKQDIRRGRRVRVDVTAFAMEAMKYYGGHMRILMKVRDDWTYGKQDTNKDRNFIVFHSRESLLKPNSVTNEIGNPVSLSNLVKPKAGIGPTIDITYRDLT